MRDNKLSGEIPSWITSLLNLWILLLKGNSLGGSIPIHLCQLRNISILDLSQNYFSGSIPSCLSHITFGRGRTLDDTFLTEWLDGALHGGLSPYSYESQLNLSFNYVERFAVSEEKEEVIFLSKSRSETYTGNVLYFISGMDLSCNNLTGSIPSEIGYLSWIHTLNLSYNQFTGSIPNTFSNLRGIQSLDLSHNTLSGQIPSQLVELTFLSVFRGGYNKLSGKTPDMKAQFATFDESSYEDNPLLCGKPLEKICPDTYQQQAPPSSEPEEDDSFKIMFYWSFGGSYVVAFLGSVALLYINSYYVCLISKYVEARVFSCS